jgi:hypothetical protein
MVSVLGPNEVLLYYIHTYKHTYIHTYIQYPPVLLTTPQHVFLAITRQILLSSL